MLLLHSAGWQYCLINVVDGDPVPYTHTLEPLKAQLWVSSFFSPAMMLTSVSYMVLSVVLAVLLFILCDKYSASSQGGPVMWDHFAFLKLYFLFLFAAYAVIANGQVECSKGFKRMNLTHCQGKLYCQECILSRVTTLIPQ